MRIVHVITRLIIGGAQENTLLSCEGLADRGHEVVLIAGPTTGPEGSLVDRARAGRYAYREIPSLVRPVCPWRDSRALFALVREFETLRPDVVHTHSSKAGILGRLAASLAGVPIVVHTIHGMSFNRTQPRIVQAAYAAAERFCAARCRGLVSVADAMTRQALDAGIGRPDQYETIRSGMAVDGFDPRRQDHLAARRRWGIEPEETVIGTVARLFVNKGYEQLIDVMSRMMDRSTVPRRRLRFLWIGDGAQRARYEQELVRRGLRDRVIITGLLPPEEMPAALAAVDILAHTSQWEGLPRAVVQAMLMERPAVCFDIDGAPEVVTPGETGAVVPLGDHERFAGELLRLAADPALRARYGTTARHRCLEAFDHRVMVERLDELYRRLGAN